MDFIQHYRPSVNVVKRPTLKGGKGYTLIGHHEIMFPLLAAAVIEKIQGSRIQGSGKNKAPFINLTSKNSRSGSPDRK